MEGKGNSCKKQCAICQSRGMREGGGKSFDRVGSKGRIAKSRPPNCDRPVARGSSGGEGTFFSETAAQMQAQSPAKSTVRKG